MWPILAIGMLLAFSVEAAVIKPDSEASSCGAEPKGLYRFDAETTACWHDAAVPSATLGFTASKQDQTRFTAGSWPELKRILDSTDKPIIIRLSGSLTASYPVQISSRSSVTVLGPAKVICNGLERHPAIIVNRASRVVLQDLTVSGCSDSAVIINGTATGRPEPITTSGSGATPPDVLLRHVVIRDCTSSRGGGVAVINSRVVLQDSLLLRNTADGCGGGLYTENSSLLVMGTNFTDNLGNNTAVDDSCRGGALHAQNSWLAVTHSSFVGNRGVNGSAVLLLLPVGIAQLQDTTFSNNQPRQGLTKKFSSSTGAVSVVGAGVDYVQLSRGPKGAGAACAAVKDGLAVVRCSFNNNTAALTGGEGGALSGYEAFLAVINTTITGTPPRTSTDGQQATPTNPNSIAYSTGRDRYRDMVLSAYMGGCLSVEASSLLVSGTVISHCGARFVGGGISLLTVTAVVEHTILSHNYGDMGGGIRATNGYLSMSNVSVLHNRGLSSAAGVYLESNELLNVHMEQMNVHYNALTGRGGGMLGEMVNDNANFILSLHDSNFTHNTGTYGGAMCMYSITAADLKNNHVAHNTALKFGGGMECAKFFGQGSQHLSSVNNTWLNNTALIRGGGIITHPCNMTSHGDIFLTNRAAQEGGGVMVYGGQNVRLQNAQVSCNTAQNGAGLMVKLSDSGDLSHLYVTCSNITGNGGSASPSVQGNCVSALMILSKQYASKTQTLLAGVTAATGGTADSSGKQPAAVTAEKGGGVYVAPEQLLDVFNSTISGNIASSSGAGVYMDRRSVVRASGTGGSVSHNTCTGGSGGGVFMDEGTKLTAADITWSNNQGMFGGAVFALGNNTSAKLANVMMSNNTAAAGGAVASLGGSSITCSSGCVFRFNNAKVGGALMLHGGSININGSTLLGNSAVATSGMTAAAAAAGSGAGSGTIQYMLGEVQVSAGGAAYVWRGRLQLNRCNIVSNTAWGPTGRGGGIFVDDSQLLLVDSVFSSNWAAAAGGAILLGPVGSRQLLEVRSGKFAGNGAGLYGGAVAGGLLLPGDVAAASAGARGVIANSSGSSSSSGSVLVLNGTELVNNTAGRQGGAVACSLCDRLILADTVLQQNGAAETGGGLSCVGCTRLTLDNSTFSSNTAASGGGACILAAGEGSVSKDTDYLGNAAGATAAATSRERLEAAMSTAAAVAGLGVAVGGTTPAAAAAVSRLPTAQQALPGCGVVGSGGGLCLGLWDTEFLMQGSGRYTDNAALFGAGLFIDACSQGPQVCPVRLNPRAVTFQRNLLTDDESNGAAWHLLQVRAAAAAAGVEGSLGSGADLYVTNATVLVMHKDTVLQGDKQTAATAQSVVVTAPKDQSPRPPHIINDSDKLKWGSTDQAAAEGRHLLAQQPQHQAVTSGSNAASVKPLAVAQQLAAAVQPSQEAGATSADDVISRVATGPARLGPIMAIGATAGSSSAGPASLMGGVDGAVADKGRLQGLSLPVLDQLGEQVADDVAEQLSVQAAADFGNCTACQLSGISKVLPVNGTARFDQLQVLAQPGSNQTITFKLLSALEGVELPGGGQAVTVRLPSCQWGQATTAVGCYNCTSPLFSFSPSTSKCSICPDNAAYCSFTTLLPDSGYWTSGPLSTRMHKCPRRKACLRDAGALMTLQCLQQQQLVLNNPEFAYDSVSDIGISSNTTVSTRWTQPLSSWYSLRHQCVPILHSWAAKAMAAETGSRRRRLQAAGTAAASSSMMVDPYLDSTAAVDAAYSSLMCAQGYTGRLCTKCIFPGTANEGPYGHFQAGCGRCPAWVTSLVTFVLSRLFDILLVGLLILTTLVEMKKRRADVQQARKTALSKLAMSLSPAAAAAAAAAVSAAPATCQLQSAVTATASCGSGTPTASTLDPQSSTATAIWASGAAASGDQCDDAPLPPASDQQQQQEEHDTPRQEEGLQSWQPSGLLSNQMQVVDQQQQSVGPQPSAACQLAPQGTSDQLQVLAPQQAVHDPQVHGSLTAQHHQLLQQQQQKAGVSGLTALGSSGLFASPVSAFAVPGAVPSAAVSAGVSGVAPPAAAAAPQRRQRRPMKRGPLFAREITSRTGSSVVNYSPAQLTTVELFEVFKDFLQVLSILQAVLLGWQTAAAAALSAVSVTPLSTTAWISLDCILPRTDYVAIMLPFYQIAASLLLPLSYAALLLLLWFTYAVSFSLRTRQSFWRMTLNKRLKAPIVSSLLVLLSFFYPSLAYTILSVFSCRYLDPSGDSSNVPGEVLDARGWYWAADLNRQCFMDPGHRAIALGLGIPGTLLLLAYPLLQGILLARQAAAGQLTPTSEFFADYGHLVEDFRPRLFYWGSVVEVRKLVLVAVVLGLASTGVISQLVGCSLVLLGFCAATMGLLPYPYRLLNRLHLGSAGVLLAVIWLNLFIAVGEEGGMLSGGISPQHSLVLQLLSVALVVLMILLLLSMCTVRLYRKVRGYLDVDGDGRISWADIQALLARLQSKAKPGLASKVLPCICINKAKGQTST